MPALRRILTPALQFEPLQGLDGFRRASTGEASAGDPALIGVGNSDSAAPVEFTCDTLFDGPTPPGTVPIAYFSDARCIFCRILTPLLHKIEAREPVAITWHEFPLLGPASLGAARASVAAGLQGAYRTFHDRLMGTPFLPNEAYLRTLATEAGIDADRLLQDMQSDIVSERIARTARVARAFGFYGTPALVIGRTAILGQVSEAQLRALIKTERESAAEWPCR